MSKQYTGPLRETLELILRQDEWVEIPLEIGLYLQELDKENSLVYVELPNDENSLRFTKLWSIKAWRLSVEKHKLAKIEAVQRKLEWDNLQENLKRIANRLSEITLMLPSQCMDMAQETLKKNPESLSALGITIIHPYYRGQYSILPFREPSEYRGE